MIRSDAALSAEWIDPLLIGIDHHAHGTPIDGAHVQALVARLQAEPGLTTDPVLCERDTSGRLWIVNGRHRVLAHLLAARERIAVVIASGGTR